MTRSASVGALLLAGFLQCFTANAQSLVQQLGISVTGASHEFSFTNKQSAFYNGETSRENTTGWQGFNVFGHEFLDDYRLLIDGVPLRRSDALRVVVYPDYLVRTYPGGIVEEFRLVDSLALFAVHISAPRPVEVTFIPLFSDGRRSSEYDLALNDESAILAKRSHLQRRANENYPVWLAVAGKGFLPVRDSIATSSQFSPLLMQSMKKRQHVIACAVADESKEAERLATGYAKHATTYAASRRARMERLLTDTRVTTESPQFDKALSWAKLSLDALTMNQVSRGIFAGLPWFNNYWGRDTFISLPGAAIVTGRFPLAREILRSFASYQQIDSTSDTWGRIPNLVTTTDKAYNTADGTPRFVMMAREYVERSGDSSFILEVYPTVLRSIEGTLKHHCDTLGFLTHADADTWMDAVGPDGPWSPRGNRANDIQALWADQLRAGIWFATRVGDVTSAQRWQGVLLNLRRQFIKYFVADGTVADRLHRDGTRDMTLRPNQIFTLPLLDTLTQASVVRTVVQKLTYPYGVASLSQDDSLFHPYHQNPPWYPKDAAYHNGTVWTWLQGALISALCSFNEEAFAMRLTENSVHQILDRGAVGTQSELLDALPHPGEKEPRLSGTFSQAWNLGEFVRNFYDDFLGLRINAYDHVLVIDPHLPPSLGAVTARLMIGNMPIDVAISRNHKRVTVRSRAQELGRAKVSLPSGSHRLIASLEFVPGSSVEVGVRADSITVSGSARVTQFDRVAVPSLAPGPLQFQTPRLRPGLKALRGPDYPLLPHALIRTVPPRSARLLADGTDPAGDDHGPGNYTYPRSPNFVAGSFDITGMTVRADSTNAYFTLRFRALSNPGWHPEYGFQLTIVSILIDTDRIPGSGAIRVGHNAQFSVDSSRAFEREILVGGGIRVEDGKGNILAEYAPAPEDVRDPIGDARTGRISFAIPLRYLGDPSTPWAFTVIAGAQDDHGGAGIGEFRNIQPEAGEWNGGGKVNPQDPNVYDIMER